jgi:hypothetical protein
LEQLNLAFGPTVNSAGFNPNRFDVACWIIGSQADLDSVLHKDAQNLPKLIRCLGPIPQNTHQFDNMLAA